MKFDIDQPFEEWTPEEKGELRVILLVWFWNMTIVQNDAVKTKRIGKQTWKYKEELFQRNSMEVYAFKTVDMGWVFVDDCPDPLTNQKDVFEMDKRIKTTGHVKVGWYIRELRNMLHNYYTRQPFSGEECFNFRLFEPYQCCIAAYRAFYKIGLM